MRNFSQIGVNLNFSHTMPLYITFYEYFFFYISVLGLSGVVLTVLLIVLFIFALPIARRHLFHMFWKTHKLYLIVYILTFVHGSARLVQEPHFPYYIVGPAVLFIIDKLISISRATIELTVIKAELLPSGKNYFLFGYI